ncbi:MAG: Uma2 family endonuclease [Acidobacteria bacterium]|nr:Uma2 family endonuclease [Acidobacteriota bacterium]
MATSIEELKAIIGQAPQKKRYTIAEFIEIAEDHPDQWLELIDGEIVIVSKPDKKHQKHAGRIINLFAHHLQKINAIGCQIGGTNFYFEVTRELKEKALAKGEKLQSDVCPDASISYQDFLDTDRIPPAPLIVEILSDSNRENLERDTITKPDIYAALKIPAYWVVDRRDQSVWAYTEPVEGKYTVCEQIKGDAVLPAPGLEFLQITPARIFSD